ncbi:MAG: alkaline phosphatase family protein [Phycisphaerales bacterium]|jgi:predicted AlkP superfamily pyrophosphatase or phosphodiesterase|nr:alkaline phosphatase family protein [Phycisphaerales bacterium]
MPNRLCVIDLPGLSNELLPFVSPHSALGQWLTGRAVCPLKPSLPALTCGIQATITTGTPPSRHGIIANGLPTFLSSDDAALVDVSSFGVFRRQISFWEQSNQLVQSPRFWQTPDGQSKYPTALLFFQNSMPGFAGRPQPAADIVLTPKPDHGPDGKLTSLCWSNPPDLIPRLFHDLGPFPLLNYWGPMANINSSRWIAQAATRIWSDQKPTLQLVYIPHLDYDLQRFGPSSPHAKKAVEDVAAALDPLLSAVLTDGGQLAIFSEYAMNDVNRYFQPNRMLADAGLLQTRPTDAGPLIDFAQSRALAMVDHQIAHVYARDAHSISAVREIFASIPDIQIFGRSEQQDQNLNHRRSGDLVLIAPQDGWFDYRWWSNPADAPTFAGEIDIHRKPGYDALELFFDPATRKISQNPTLVRGSHGRADAPNAIFIGGGVDQPLNAVEVASILERMIESCD